MKNYEVAIIGAGDIGKAVGHLLQKNGLSVGYWDVDKSRMPEEIELKDLVSNAKFIFLCIPSWCMADCVKSVEGCFNKNAKIISLTKGIEGKSGEFTGEFLVKTFGKDRVGILAGPMLAAELEMGIKTAAALAGDKKFFDETSKIFAGTSLFLYHCDDVVGASMASVLKNIYAMGLGIADALDLGSNYKGAYVNLAIFEMGEILKGFGCRPETAVTMAGLGDLVATGSSKFSKNRTLGEEIIKTGKYTVKSEGISSLPFFLKRLELAKISIDDLPVFLAVKKVLIDGKSPSSELNSIFS
ncbi:MAG: NAD(P)-dependent oxidoreductase [Candidatus Paceibacterota bacterium]